MGCALTVDDVHRQRTVARQRHIDRDLAREMGILPILVGLLGEKII